MTTVEGQREPPAAGMAEEPAFGVLLRSYRIDKGLTQEELAERGGVGVRNIGDMERGVPHTPRKETVKLLAAALGLTMGEQAAFEEAARRMGRARTRQRNTLGTVGQPATTEQVPAQTTGPAPVAAPASRVRHNLPVQLTTFIGREQLLATVRGLLSGAPDGPHLVTMTGVGGGGKTRLALEVAAGLLNPAIFPDGVFFVGLASLADPDLVVPTIARTLGVHDVPGRPPLASLQEHLRGSRLLLVLDNMEHLLVAAPIVTALLGACPGLRVLATSRAPLRLYGEREELVPPLDLPDPRQRLSLEGLAGYDAVRLFVARAQDVAPGFALTAENISTVTALCHRLEGVPLALELAATRSKVLSPAAILARLDRRLPLLTGGARDLPARHQTLRGALAWSYELLPPAQQALFRRLGIFSGGCTLEAAGAVCLAADNVPEAPLDALDGITQLVDHSLLWQVGRTAPAGAADEPRFMMLETMREYAREQLAAHGELQAVRQRHAAYFWACGAEAYGQLGEADVAPWLPGLNTDATAYLRLIENDYDNLRAALQWTIAHGDAVQSAGLVSALAPFWALRGHSGEGQPWIVAVLTLLRTPEQAMARVGLLQWAAELALRHGDYETAQGLQEENLARRRQAADKRGEAIALRAMGINAYCCGDAETAHRCSAASLATWRELGDRRGIADALVQMWDIELSKGNRTAALLLLEESLRLARETRDQGTIVSALAGLGQMATDDGDYARAHLLLEESRAIVGDNGDRWALNGLLYFQAWLALEEVDHVTARVLLTQILTFWRETDMSGHYPALALMYSASLAAAQGQPERALRLAAAAGEHAGTPLPLGFRPTWAAVRPQLEHVRRAVGETTYAVTTAEGQAMSLARAIAYALDESAPA